jgi:hypothetical protein
VNDLAARLDRAIKAAGVAIVGVTIGDPANKATWTVQPPNLQGAAQSIIDALSITDPPARPVVAVGLYIGAFDADPESVIDGDLWIVRNRFPAQSRQLRFRDGDITRVLVTITL